MAHEILRAAVTASQAAKELHSVPDWLCHKGWSPDGLCHLRHVGDRHILVVSDDDMKAWTKAVIDPNRAYDT